MRYFWLLICLSLSLFTFAEEKVKAPETKPVSQKSGDQTNDLLNLPPPDYQPEQGSEPLPGSMSAMKALGSLLFVLGLIGGLAYAVKRWLPTGMKAGDGSNHFEFIQNFPLGQKKYLSLVEVDGKKMLLGITDHQISFLKSFEEFPFSESVEDMKEAKTVGELLGEEHEGTP